MKLALLALFAAAVAAKDSGRQKLVELAAANNGVIKLDASTFDLLTSAKRNWSASIQFTAMDPRRKCNPCQLFGPSWNTVAKAWSTAPSAARDDHFFATIDFDDAQAVFAKNGIQSAPVVHMYPPTEGDRKPKSGKTDPIKYDFSYGFDPLPLAEQLSAHTPIPIPYKAPVDWSKWLTVAVATLALLVSIRFIRPVLTSRWSWAALSIITCLVMTSGYMFTRIRASPWSGGGGQWIAAGYQNQFGQEVQVVASLYGLLSFAFLMLTLSTPRQLSPARQRIQVYIWTAVIMCTFSILVSLFRVKNRGYPFRLFL